MQLSSEALMLLAVKRIKGGDPIMKPEKIRALSAIIRNQAPLTLPPETPLRDACKAMHQRHVGAVLVVDAEARLLGIFTGRDAVGRVLAGGLDPSTLTLADVMTRNPDCISAGRNAVEAMHRMQDGGFRHLPILEGDRLVGVVSHGDFRGLEHATFDDQTGIWERI
jgi:CBS domain-containing protein